ncbi:MAG: M43 family zinc metalloprotease [Chitinophagales bacterium]|nr:M43 family zinc metalloprotease [Chitinophagales bacterium]
MKNLYLLLTIFVLCVSFNILSAQERCATDEVYEIEKINHPELIQKRIQIEEEINYFLQNNQFQRAADEKYIIPVVFHIVYKNSEQNIPDFRLQEQMDVINKDFNALNTDLNTVPSPFVSSIGQLGIEFVFANRDPNGNPTNGINRYPTNPDKVFNYSNPNDIKRASTGGADAWDTRRYLNIWICELSDNTLGYSTFPSSVGQTTDGFVMDYRYVGTSVASTTYNLGRTATHELGHYFGLFHIWGNEERNCNVDDGITDTPNQFQRSSGNPTFPLTDQCSSNYPGIMYMNYMDYTRDKYLVMFTKGQVERMKAAIQTQRSALTQSNGYVKEQNLVLASVDSPNEEICGNTFQPKISLSSLGTETINSIEIGVTLNQENEKKALWNGALNSNQTLTLEFSTLNAPIGINTITFSIKKVNGIDVNSSLYTSRTVSFRAGAIPIKDFLTEDFETDITQRGFDIINSDDKITWSPSNIGDASKGSYSYYMDNYNYDPQDLQTTYGQKDDINLPLLDFSDKKYNNHRLRFDLAATQYSNITEPNNNWDSLQVLVSTDCGAKYNVIYNKFGTDLMTAPTQTTPFFPGTNSNFWRKENIDLSAYDGYNDVKIKIRNISQWENNIFIDNLVIDANIPTGVNDHSAQNTFQLYPNPTNGWVHLKTNTETSSIKQVSWFNSVGQIVLSKEVPTENLSLDFDFSKMAKGLYIVRVLYNNGNTDTQKLIVK